MTKIILDDLTSIQNDPTAVDTINDNSAIIEDAFDRVLFRDGTAPNKMSANLDMDSNKILNLPAPRSPLEPARLKDIGDAPQYAEDAAESAAEAAASALSAAADAAAAHADRLLADADVVLTHADVVLTHADVVTTNADAATATTQAGIATTQAGIATTQAGIATTQAGNAATSASNAYTSELNAATSETNAATSESNASTSAANALTSENNAEQSLEDFQDIYLGAYATDPTVTPTGAPVATGMLYWNTGSTELRIYDGASWAAYSPSTGVSSVFGRTGAVIAVNGDYAFSNLSGNISTSQMNSGTGATSSTFFRGDGTWASPGGGVTSWNGRTGAVVPASSDYTVAQVTGAAPLASPVLTGIPTAPTATAGTNTTQVATTAFVTGAIREKLTASRTYYVLTTGNDSNTGLVNNAGGAFLTIQKAINTVAGLDLNGQTCTIQVGAGTYTGSVNVSVPFVGGVPTLVGDTTTPSNVLLNVSSYAVRVGNGAEINIRGFKITSTGDGILAENAGRANINGNMEYGACTSAHMHAKYAGLITVTANYSVTGGAAWHWWSETAGGSIQVIGRTITITGTPNFSGAWAGATIVAQIVPVSNTYSGSATGTRYIVQLNGVIYSSGATLPGSVAGSALTGGQYN